MNPQSFKSAATGNSNWFIELSFSSFLQSGRRSGGSSKSGRRSRKSSAKSVKSLTSQIDTAKEDQEGTPSL